MVVLPWQLWHMSIELINEFENFHFQQYIRIFLKIQYFVSQLLLNFFSV
jgi:hypothetical protein